MKYTARHMKRSELTKVVMMCRDLHEVSDWSFIRFSAAAMRRSLSEAFSRKDYQIFVCQDQAGDLTGILIGTLGQVMYNGKTLYATDAEFAASGGGDELLEAFREWAKQRGAAVIVMGVSNSGREPAKDRFFSKHGMTRTGGMYQERLK